MKEETNSQSAKGGAGEAAFLRDLAALPKAIRPARDPWQQISQRIAGAEVHGSAVKRQNPNFKARAWLALAASLILVAISSFFLMQSAGIQSPVRQPVAAIDVQAQAPYETTKRWPTTSLEREYQAAFREFARLDFARKPVPDITREAMVQDWELMQQLEKDLLAALQTEPDNPLLLDRWRHLRARQLQLLHVIADTGRLPGGTLI